LKYQANKFLLISEFYNLKEGLTLISSY